MHTLEAIILGAVQGLTEFIPISSSAHLVILPWLFGWQTPGLVFDVALHLGTLFALLAYFWREWYGMVRAYFSTGERRSERMMLWPVVLACVPAGLSGMYFEHTIEEVVRTKPLIIGIATIALGILLFVADRLGRQRRSMYEIGLRDWMIVGLAQALAIFPGVSRSGITITAGLLCGLQREASARFSFLLGAPIILGAAVFKLKDLFEGGLPASQVMPFILGVVTASVVGYLCIGFLLGYLKKRSMGIFVGYRLVFGAFVITLALLRG